MECCTAYWRTTLFKRTMLVQCSPEFGQPRVFFSSCLVYDLFKFNPQCGPQRPMYQFKITCTFQFSSDQHNAFSSPQKYCFKHVPVISWISFLKCPCPCQCLCDRQPNGSSLKEIDVCHLGMWATKHTLCLNWLAMASRNILIQQLQLLLISNGQDFNLT